MVLKTTDYATYIFNAIGLQDSTMLIVSDPFGCSDSIVYYAYVRDIPNADFYTTDTNYCKSSEIQFFDNSFTTGSIQVTDWTFSSGSIPTSNIADPLVSFTSAGNALVTLFVEDEFGCYDDTLYSIEIDSLPNVSFTWNDTCAGQDIYFKDESQATTNPINFSWNWDFGDGENSSSQNPIYDFNTLFQNPVFDIYQGVHQHEVFLEITDEKGCKNSIINTVNLHPIPDVRIIAGSICQDTSFTFINDTRFNIDQTDWQDTISTYTWLFDQLPPTYINPWVLTDTGFTVGLHSINLLVETDWGCSADVTELVEIWRNPEIEYEILYPDFGINPVCIDVGGTVSVDFNSEIRYYNSMSVTIYDPVNLVYLGDSLYEGNDAINFSTSITDPGIFDLNIYVSNSRCHILNKGNIKIHPNPTAKMSPGDTAGCEVFIVPFQDSSFIENAEYYSQYGDTSSLYNWYWDFGNGAGIGITQSETSTYASASSPYTTTLIVTTNHGCKDTVQHKIIVDATPVAKFVTPLIQNIPYYGTYFLDGRQSETSIGDSASTNLYNYEWLIEDGSDWVEILNGNPGEYGPRPDYLLYQYNYVMNCEDSSKICLWVTNKTILNTAAVCYDSTCHMVLINCINSLFVPNALYPTDKSSDAQTFLPRGKSLGEYQLQIFDKFGSLLWETNELDMSDGSPKNGWEGITQNGIALPQGTYVWKIRATFSDGSPWEGMSYKNSNAKIKEGALYLIR